MLKKEKELQEQIKQIENEYLTKNINIYHFDLYRIENSNELYNVGIEEYFYGEGICFIEWPERAKELFVGNTKVVNIYKLDD